MTYRRPSLDGF